MTTLEQTEKTADRIRDELLATLKELDRRRRLAIDWRYQARQHSVVLVAAAISLVLVAGFAAYVARVRKKTRRPRLMRERIRAAKRIWEQPKRLTDGAERSLPAELGRKAAVAAVTAAVSRAAKQATRRAFRG